MHQQNQIDISKSITYLCIKKNFQQRPRYDFSSHIHNSTSSITKVIKK